MSLRTELGQIIALTIALLIASFLSIPVLSVVLAHVQVYLVLILGVALLYQGILLRRATAAPATITQREQEPRERERGA